MVAFKIFTSKHKPAERTRTLHRPLMTLARGLSAIAEDRLCHCQSILPPNYPYYNQVLFLLLLLHTACRLIAVAYTTVYVMYEQIDDPSCPIARRSSWPRANAPRSPARCGCAAFAQTPPSWLWKLCPLFLPAVPGPLHPIRSTSSLDPPGPSRSSASELEKSSSALPLCYPSSLPVSFISCASSTSITWGRTASRFETGLLIPSSYNS
jgi:hypothetical protein